MLDLQMAQTVMQREGVRLTPQRLAVLEALIGNTSHPTVDGLFDTVRRTCPTISLATVYNTVAMLIRHGLILELRGGRDGLRCDPNTNPHAHAYCLGCGEVYDLPLPYPEAWDASYPPGFRITGVEVSITGYCAHCQEPHA